MTLDRNHCSLRGEPESGEKEEFKLQIIKSGHQLKEGVRHLVPEITAMPTPLNHLNDYVSHVKTPNSTPGGACKQSLLDHPERYQGSGLRAYFVTML